MKQIQDMHSETDRLIDRAIAHDLHRLPEPPKAPSARLLRKLSTATHLSGAHSLGFVATKWLMVLALGSLTAGAAYFALHSKFSPAGGPNSIKPRPAPIRMADTASVITRTTPPFSLDHPSSKSYPSIHTPQKNVKTIVSDDSLLQEEIAHPVVIPPLDSARTTIHTQNK